MSSFGRAFLAALLGVCFASSSAGQVGSASRPAPVAASQADLPQDSAWAVLRGARVEVFHAPRHAALAERVLAFLEAQPPLPALPASVPTHVQAFLAPDPDAFSELTGGAVPDWSAGVAIPARGRIVVPAYRPEVAVTGSEPMKVGVMTT